MVLMMVSMMSFENDGPDDAITMVLLALMMVSMMSCEKDGPDDGLLDEL